MRQLLNGMAIINAVGGPLSVALRSLHQLLCRTTTVPLLEDIAVSSFSNVPRLRGGQVSEISKVRLWMGNVVARAACERRTPLDLKKLRENLSLVERVRAERAERNRRCNRGAQDFKGDLRNEDSSGQ